jgi:hypothetical protein
MTTDNAEKKKSKRREITYEVNEKGCHVCTSHTMRSDGTIQMKLPGGKRVSLARLVYEETFGPVPEGEGKIIFTTCGTPGCINPEHLRLGTQAEKVAYQVVTGRIAVGTHNGRAKLNEKIVREILLDTTTSHAELARRYGVDQHIISRVKKRTIWGHVKVDDLA